MRRSTGDTEEHRFLEAPFIGGGGVAVGLGGVGVGEGEIVAHHFEGGVTKQALQGEDVTTVSEVLDRKGVAEAVGVGVGDAGTVAVAVSFPTQQIESITIAARDASFTS